MSSLSICGFIGDICSVECMPLKMINAEEQVTEVITEVAEQKGFSDVKAKQREAILAFLSGKDTLILFLFTLFVFVSEQDKYSKPRQPSRSIQETCCSV